MEIQLCFAWKSIILWYEDSILYQWMTQQGGVYILWHNNLAYTDSQWLFKPSFLVFPSHIISNIRYVTSVVFFGLVEHQ
jgi:lysophospholipid acyltransferase (LPLAT)-like uncharacterized protein